MKTDKKLRVSAIKNGTVIDHIPAKNLFKVISILGLEKMKNHITFGTNLESQKLGNKAIIKMSDKFFAENEINKIALVAPEASLSIIKNYQLVNKHAVVVPKTVVGIVKCVNPKCISNHEEITTRFQVIPNGEEIELKCHYCEKITDQDNMKIL